MIWFTGDIHGEVKRVREGILRHNILPGDTVVILGDLGLNYHKNAIDRRRKEKLERTAATAGVTIFCIHGNHDMRPWHVPTYVEREWHGGRVWVEEAYPHLLFARDGELFDLDGHQAIVAGGAYSVDKVWRQRMGWTWFPDEQPTDEIKADVEATLGAIGWDVDLVLTHTCPYRMIPTEAMLPGVNQSTVDQSTERWLDTIAERLQYRQWLCGHWHINKHVGNFHFLMQDYMKMEELF